MPKISNYWILRPLRWGIRNLFELILFVLVGAWKRKSLSGSIKSILVLRNNDMGDLLIVTPLFEALKKKYPNARIYAGIGSWNNALLENNPHVDEVLSLNAPWYNKVIQSQSLVAKVKYLFQSKEVRELKKMKIDVAIDVLGSHWGMLLFLRAGICYRLSVKGYAGGWSAAQGYVRYDTQEHVAQSALRFAGLLGANEMPACRPQLYLTSEEKQFARGEWKDNHFRVIVAPGGGREDKCWPASHYVELARKLSQEANVEMIVVGGMQDVEVGNKIEETSRERIKNKAGAYSLRETLAVSESADLVICNSSFMMHVGGAFLKETVVLLGEFFHSTNQHLAQWGYEKNCHILGKEPGVRDSILSAGEAYQVITSTIKKGPWHLDEAETL